MPNKKSDFFIVSRVGRSKPKASFYNAKGSPISKDDLEVTYKRARTGRFVTREYNTFLIGRDARSGEFMPARYAERHPNTSTIERIPKSGRGNSYTEDRISKDSPVYFQERRKHK